MKRTLCFFLILAALLCGCQSIPAETTVPTTQAETQPTETKEAVWTGFTGTLEGYTFYHETQRDKNWEEEILTVAQVYLEEHPWLVDDTTRTSEVESYISTPNWEWKSQYIPEKREEFLAAVNELIPRIPEYEDEILKWEFQRVLAGIGECHASLQIDGSETFRIHFYPFYEEDGMVIRAVTVPEDKPHLLYAELIAINGVPVDEVLQRIRPYSSADADTGFINDAVIFSTMVHPGLLRTVGILEADADTAEFTLLTESGETVTETRTARSVEEYADLPLINHFYKYQFPYSFSVEAGSPYWIDHLEQEKTLYIRLSSFRAEDEETFLKTNREISGVLNNVDSLDKVILDLRQNGGGSPPRAYAGLFNFLRNSKVKQVYVLIDSGAFSMSVIACYNIRTEIPGAIFVGTPTGQGLPTGSVREYAETPHGWLKTRIPGGMSLTVSGDSFTQFEPDVLVYQTLEDYKAGIDTVLQYVLDQK